MGSGGYANGVNFGTSISQFVNPFKMRVYLNGTQFVDQSATTRIAWDTMANDGYSWDTANGYNLTTHQYTVQVSGYYQINSVIQSSANTTGVPANTMQFWQLYAVINNVIRRTGPMHSLWNAAPSGWNIGGIISTQIYANLGDLVEIQINTLMGGTAGTTIPIATGGAISFWEMQLLSL